MLRVDVPEGTEPASFVWGSLGQHVVPSALEFSGTVYAKSKLSLRLFEAIRIRVAQINGCELCQSWRSQRDAPAMLKAYGVSAADSNLDDGDPPDEAFYEALADWRSAAELSERERVAVAFTDRYLQDPVGLNGDDELWTQIRSHFSDDEVVDMAMAIGAFFTLGRLQAVLGIDDACQIETMFAPENAATAT
jgi:alkylhydroperoxidase family enzyme